MDTQTNVQELVGPARTTPSKTGLVLEGGGMRGLFTCGVLDCFLDHGVTVDYCVGVSAGACNGSAYVSGQRGRNRRINISYARDKRYVSIRNFLKTKSMFGMDFIFREIPERLDPFDFAAFQASPIEFYAGVTDLETGAPVYFGKETMTDNVTVLAASSAIPVFSPPVEFLGRRYLDGGAADPIPVRKAMADGCTHSIVVLTRDRSYRKGPEQFRAVYRRLLKGNPAMIGVLDRRHEVYNSSLELLHELEQEGKVLVLAPAEPVRLSRFEKDPERLEQLYQQGYNIAEAHLQQIFKFIKPKGE